MEKYVSDALELPAPEEGERLVRVDFVFYGVDHSGPSYEARVFVNNPDADVNTPRDASAGYAGSFTVFGHGGCYGDEGHCDREQQTRDAFDVRPPHPLTPWTKTVIVDEDLYPALGESVTVTVVAVVPGSAGPEATDALSFERVRLVTHADL
ncbi:MAG: hypothetical protein M3322_07125 [Actinomycetota bacterium]|nr:hypothetical protein [Actinomycetota bacterium]